MKLHDFYKKFAKIPNSNRDIVLVGVRHDPLTMMVIYKQLEYARAQLRFFKAREEELLRIAEETFNQVEK